MAEKLMQNRIVVVGRNNHDAYDLARKLDTGDLESPVLVNAASHRLTILGTLAGMHIGTVHVTSTAHEGVNWDVVTSALEKAQERNPKMRVLEQTRVVSA
jgi:hypothetical protein